MNWNERAEKAMDAALRFINSHFGKKDKPMPIVRIPAQPESDSDLVLINHITESAQRIAELEAMLSSRTHTEETASRFTDLRLQKSGHSAVPGNLGLPPIGGSHVIPPGHVVRTTDSLDQREKRIAMLEKALSQAMEISGIELREAIGILQPDGGGSNHPAEFRVFGHPTDAHKYPELAAYLREQDHIVEAQEMVEEQQ